MAKQIAVSALIIGCLCLAACISQIATGPDKTDSIHIDAGAAEKANVELDMGAGQMNIGGGAPAGKLIDGNFTYNVEAWKPLVTHSINGDHATVTIKQPEHGSGGGNTKYVWDLNLNDKLLTDLSINCGAGQAQLNLGTLLLRSLDVHMGAGQVQLDLRGTPTHDYDVKIAGGVGQATIHLPTGVGIYAEAHGGLGSVNVTGLDKHGDHWENDLYNKSKVTVKLEVNGGVGEIKITE